MKTEIKKACVIGWPIKHSRSPLIHGYWLKKYNIAGSYDKQAVEPERFADFLKSMPDHGYVGANVTVPHKEHAFSLVCHADETARSVKAVNTLWFENGQLCGSNTDVYGFIEHLMRSAPDWKKYDRPVCILGAGGAARGIIYGLLREGVSEIRLLNRTKERAEELAAQYGSKIKVKDWSDRDEVLRECGLLVNTTTLGMTGERPLEINLNALASDAVVYDIVYVPLETSLLQQARVKGFQPVDGLGMLLHQAVPGFELWFGHKPEVTEELRALIVSDLIKV